MIMARPASGPGTGNRSRSLRALVLVTAALVLAYWGIFGWMVYRSPLPYDAIDLDHDGSVSFTEADYASSFGMRTIYRQGEKCVEYFAEKDGAALKLVCP
ncbi:hypothetical protein [Massilia sp. GCM10023247]|uniref:hypothetical protein n=1 Tax=Massilia sp. GCM10023247 TaxID=3252643 RepID=UPI0036134E03